MSAVRLDGIFAGCNRDPDTADWCHELDLVAFAAASTICIYSPTQCRIVCALRGHNHDAPLGARVNAVHWLPTDAALRSSTSRELVSASADRTVGVWIYIADTNTYARTATLVGHEHTVQSVCSYQCADGSMLLSSVGGDRTVRIWKRGPLSGSVQVCIQSVQPINPAAFIYFFNVITARPR
jgi:WD40 repeat protein